MPTAYPPSPRRIAATSPTHSATCMGRSAFSRWTCSAAMPRANWPHWSGRRRFRALAERVLASLPQHQRSLVDAYTQGVNAGLAHLAVRPWEYLLLDAKPQPWTNADSLLTIDAMYFDLNQDGTNARELNIARLRAVLPKPLVDFLLAPSPRWEAPMQCDPLQPVPMPDAAVFDLRALLSL